MLKNIAILILLFLGTLSAKAYEEYILSADGKLSDIKIENTEIINIYPNTSVMNERNTLIIHPLQEGKTQFSVIKDKKEKYIFDVDVNRFETKINFVEGFEVLSLDQPPEITNQLLDPPPIFKKEILEIPPQLREGE